MARVDSIEKWLADLLKLISPVERRIRLVPERTPRNGTPISNPERPAVAEG
jgi:hypothetical protein